MGWWGQLLEDAPEGAAVITQTIIDNPGPIAVVGAGAIVATRIAVRAMRPRTGLEAIALIVLLQLTLPKLAGLAVERGWLTFRVRDCEGRLVPLVPGKVETGGPVPAP
jgi:hypothetical protein